MIWAVGTHSGNRIGPRFSGVQGNRACLEFAGPPKGASRQHGRPSLLWGSHNSLIHNRLASIALFG